MYKCTYLYINMLAYTLTFISLRKGCLLFACTHILSIEKHGYVYQMPHSRTPMGTILKYREKTFVNDQQVICIFAFTLNLLQELIITFLHHLNVVKCSRIGVNNL